jgi:sortase A
MRRLKTRAITAARRQRETSQQVRVSRSQRSCASYQSRTRLGLRLLLALAIAFLVGGFVLIGYLVLRFSATDSQLSSTVSQRQAAVSKWPTAKQKTALRAAQKYNHALAVLAAQGHQPIGRQSDPFAQLRARRTTGGVPSPTSSSPSLSSSSAFAASHGAESTRPSKSSSILDTLDAQYPTLLNEGNGMMGSIEIPEISVDLPIYHGTSDTVLQIGAGYIEGTSLPIGGKSAHAVSPPRTAVSDDVHPN